MIPSKHQFASITDIQKAPSKCLQWVTRVMKGSKPVGVFFSEDEFEKFIEQMQIQFEHEERKKRQPPKSFDDLLK